jgi:hypothetical protein
MPRKPKSKGKVGLAKPVGIVKIRGATSNTYLHKLLSGQSLTQKERDALGQLVKETHRITPVSKAKAKKTGTSVFDAQTGYHEWIPTDSAFEIATMADPVWTGLYTVLRSPTWLLIVNPSQYCVDAQAYKQLIEQVAGYVKAGSNQTINASQLGLVGHSGGLNQAGTQLTTHQSTWHDELRRIFTQHRDAKSYDGYWLDLQNFMATNFLFYNDTSIPYPASDGVNVDDIMKRIKWDLFVSGRGNPPLMDTMYDIAQFLRAEWATSAQVLASSFRAYRSMAA